MNGILENLSLLAFVLVLVAAVGAVLRVISIALRNPSYLFGELVACAIALVAIAVGYGLLLRFLGLCDDIAALRKARTGTASSLD
jgi:hypothetical protein